MRTGMGFHVHAPNSRLQTVTKECVRVCEFKFHVVKLSASAWCSGCLGTSLAHVLRRPIRLNMAPSICTFLGLAFISYVHAVPDDDQCKSPPLKIHFVCEKMTHIYRRLFSKDKMRREMTCLGPSSPFFVSLQSPSSCVSRQSDNNTNTVRCTTRVLLC